MRMIDQELKKRLKALSLLQKRVNLFKEKEYKRLVSERREKVVTLKEIEKEISPAVLRDLMERMEETVHLIASAIAWENRISIYSEYTLRRGGIYKYRTVQRIDVLSEGLPDTFFFGLREKGLEEFGDVILEGIKIMKKVQKFYWSLNCGRDIEDLSDRKILNILLDFDRAVERRKKLLGEYRRVLRKGEAFILKSKKKFSDKIALIPKDELKKLLN